jgi:predicted GIY-YIG superfamily endonuclease
MPNLYTNDSDHEMWERATRFAEANDLSLSRLVVIALSSYIEKAERYAGPTSLYRLRGHDGSLLYIGISMDVPRRLDAHSLRGWWSQVDIARLQTEDFPDRLTALAAESSAIRAERPLYNLIFGSDGSVRQRNVRIEPAVWDAAQMAIGRTSKSRQGATGAKPPGTKSRNIRVSDELWIPCGEKAQLSGANLSQVVRSGLESFAEMTPAAAMDWLQSREPWLVSAGHRSRWTVNISTVARWSLYDFLTDADVVGGGTVV